MAEAVLPREAWRSSTAADGVSVPLGQSCRGASAQGAWRRGKAVSRPGGVRAGWSCAVAQWQASGQGRTAAACRVRRGAMGQGRHGGGMPPGALAGDRGASGYAACAANGEAAAAPLAPGEPRPCEKRAWRCGTPSGRLPGERGGRSSRELRALLGAVPGDMLLALLLLPLLSEPGWASASCSTVARSTCTVRSSIATHGMRRRHDPERGNRSAAGCDMGCSGAGQHTTPAPPAHLPRLAG